MGIDQLYLVAMELFLFPVYMGMYTCTDGDCGDSVTVAVAVSGTVSFVVTFLLGAATGDVVLCCTGRQRQ